MDNYKWWVFLIFSIWVSGRIPSLALFILSRRKAPIVPPFFCDECKRGSSCFHCRRQLEKLGWFFRVLFLFVFIIGVTQVQGYERVVFVCCLFFLLLISLTDSWSKLIPNNVTLPAAGMFLVLRLFIHPHPFVNYLLTALLSVSLLFLIGWLTRGIGGGDAKLLGICGLILGWSHLLLGFWVATISALLYIGIKSISCPMGRKEPFPFGPHISVGCLFSYLWGDQMFKWYVEYLSIVC